MGELGELLSKSFAGNSDRGLNCYHFRTNANKFRNGLKKGLI